MATSGQLGFTLDVQEIIEDAAERAGITKQKLNADHARTARRQMNLILTHWGNRNIRPWTLEQRSFTTVQSTVEYELDDDVIDAVDFTLARDNYEIPMLRIAREDYQDLPDKTIEGRPDRFFVHKPRVAPVVFLYQAPENDTDVVNYWAILRLETVVGSQENADIPDRWLEPFTADLAYRLYVRRPFEDRDTDEAKRLKAEALFTFNEARMEDSERADLQVVPYYDGYYGR